MSKREKLTLSLVSFSLKNITHCFVIDFYSDLSGTSLGDETLRTIARELVINIRKNLTIDWTVKESVRAKLRTTVKHLLRKYHYPPDKQEKAVRTILEQSELLCRDWAA